MGDEKTETEQQQETGSNLRQQLESTLATNKTLTDQLAELTAYKLFNDAELGHLNDEQKLAVKAVAGSDLTVELLKEKAEKLGFNKPPTPPTPPTDAPPANPVQDEVDANLYQIRLMEEATNGRRAPDGGDDFNQQLIQASRNKDQDAVMELILRDRGKHGIMPADMFE